MSKVAKLETRADRIPALDAVRGVAILAVIGTHAFNATTRAVGTFAIPPEIASIFAAGRFGVQLFFVLSGWLMFALYSEAETLGAKAYWARRLGRVWPLWAVFVVIYFALGWVETSSLPLPASILACLLFLSWLSPSLSSVPLGGKSIVLEMFHYSLFARFRRSSTSVLSISVIALVFAWFIARGVASRTAEGTLAHSISRAWINLGLEQSWPFFLLGGACFWLFQSWKQAGREIQTTRAPRRTLALVALAIAMLFLTADGSNEPIWIGLGFVVLSGSFAILANGIPGVGIALRRLGLFSYFTYFAHVFVLVALERAYSWLKLPRGDSVGTAWSLLVLFIFVMVAAVVSAFLGAISWRSFESPILGYLRAKFPSNESKIATSMSPAPRR